MISSTPVASTVPSNSISGALGFCCLGPFPFGCWSLKRFRCFRDWRLRSAAAAGSSFRSSNSWWMNSFPLTVWSGALAASSVCGAASGAGAAALGVFVSVTGAVAAGAAALGASGASGAAGFASAGTSAFRSAEAAALAAAGLRPGFCLDVRLAAGSADMGVAGAAGLVSAASFFSADFAGVAVFRGRPRFAFGFSSSGLRDSTCAWASRMAYARFSLSSFLAFLMSYFCATSSSCSLFNLLSSNKLYGIN